jgi:hypothetical protein
MQPLSGIPEKIVRTVFARRGRLHAFEAIDPKTTALDRKPGDVIAIKAVASAFFPGKCNLKPPLDSRGVDTILIAGAVTNICCESSAPSRPRQTADGPLNVGAQLALNAKPPVRRRRRIRACEQEQCGAGIRAQSR